METSTHALTAAASQLRDLLRRTREGDPTVRGAEVAATILPAGQGVVARYQNVFAVDRLARLTEDQFREFLNFKNNQHWKGLQRLGPAVCGDMPKLRQALAILLDEARPIADRLNQLIPPKGPPMVPRLHRAILTPILMVCHPTKYGVWNNVSESAMRTLGVWPELEPRMPFGNRYAAVNEVLVRMAEAVGVDLWTLDALWWRLGGDVEEDRPDSDSDEVPQESDYRFHLERHLHEFMRDNWSSTVLGRDWEIYEQDGDPDAGYEYPCPVGRIDLLARHRREPRWLVIELKRNQSSDKTVGQVLRYMGWVKGHLAKGGEAVEGLVVALSGDEGLKYALSLAPGVRLMLYEVDFPLRDV